MPVDLGEATVLMPKVTSFTIETELLPVERPAILALVLIILMLLLLAKVHQLLTIRFYGKLLNAMSVLALETVATETGLCPVLAHLTLVHGSFHERLAIEGRLWRWRQR